MNDTDLKQMIYEILERSNELNAEHIVVDVRDGTVTLRGFVETREEKHQTIRELESIEEIKSLANELDVRRPFDGLFPGAQEREDSGLVNNRTGLI